MNILAGAWVALCCVRLASGQAGGEPAPRAASTPARDEAAGARAAWEAKASELRGLDEGAFLKAARALRATPHARGESRSAGEALGAAAWDVTRVQVDADWWLVRRVMNPPGARPAPADWPAVVTVAGFPDLRGLTDPAQYEALRAIHRCPSVCWMDGGAPLDPVLIIRAVNMLQAMGEEKALETMRAYARLCSAAPMASPWQGLDACRLIVLTRLLYPPDKAAMRAPSIGAPSVCFRPGTGAASMSPLAVLDDVPFVLTRGYLLAGLPEDPLAYLEDCRIHGKFRSKPLTPTVSVVGTAESLMASLPADLCEDAGAGDREEIVSLLRLQVVAALSAVVAPSAAEHWSRVSDAEWDRVRAAAAERGVRWDAGRQDFVAADVILGPLTLSVGRVELGRGAEGSSVHVVLTNRTDEEVRVSLFKLGFSFCEMKLEGGGERYDVEWDNPWSCILPPPLEQEFVRIPARSALPATLGMFGLKSITPAPARGAVLTGTVEAKTEVREADLGCRREVSVPWSGPVAVTSAK
jgi:hypothetical protein